MENKINVKLLSMAGQGGSAFGIELMNLMQERDDIVVLSADMSTPAGLDKFKATYPERFINVGIAEQNMVGMAAGLAEEGFKPICVAQACFVTMRGFEQIRQYCGYMGIPIVLVGIGSGLSLQHMGNTHYALEDIALMRVIPGMNVVAPCDSLEAMKAVEAAVSQNTPTYIRLFGGTGIPAVYQTDFDYELGKAIPLREGQDIQIIATGSMVGIAMKVAIELETENISASVVSMHTVKPIDGAVIDRRKKLIVTVEEHHIIGGLGAAVKDFMSNMGFTTRVLHLGIDNKFSTVGSYQYLLDQNGLSIEQIKNKIVESLR